MHWETTPKWAKAIIIIAGLYFVFQLVRAMFPDAWYAVSIGILIVSGIATIYEDIRRSSKSKHEEK